MWRLAILVWLIGGTTLAGIFMTVVLVVPSLAGQSMKLIPIAVALGALVGIPIAVVVAKAITGKTA